ncbi:MAG TPA: SDR family oxidoreductase [Pyrinomonadaceae bacterium]|nr:SDR family oxidoreductase [Pyrinomonadaceae bacterium]
MSSIETFFITGFPGFIASRLLHRLAMSNSKFLLLVQPELVELALAEIRQIGLEAKRPTSDFIVMRGDITRPDLGLSEDESETVRTQTTRVFHLAAVYDLAVNRGLAQVVNVLGTKHVNEFVRSLRLLRQYHYVSTCYVAGKREGRIFETDLEHDKGFRNFYEESKYQAEIEVEQLKRQLPITIHRPAVVVGDSRSGQIPKYDGVYYLIFYLLRWPGLLSQINIGNHQVSLNLVPVDFVVEAMTALALDDSAIGKTLQLADPQPLSTNVLFDTIAGSISGRKSRVTAPTNVVQFLLMLPPSPRITGLPHHAVPYFFVNQTYDTSIARRLLLPHGIVCPSFGSYVRQIVDYAEHHPEHKLIV